MSICETCEIVWHSDGFNPPEPIYSLIFYGQYLITGGADNIARFWYIPNFNSKTSLQNGILSKENIAITSKIKLKACLESHKTPLSCVRVSPCGNYISTSSSEPFIYIWNKIEEEGVIKFKRKKALYNHEMEIFSHTFLQIPKNNQNNTSLSQKKTLSQNIKEEENKINNKEKLYFVSCSLDHKVILWEVGKSLILQTWNHSAPVKDVCSPCNYFSIDSHRKIKNNKKEKNDFLIGSESYNEITDEIDESVSIENIKEISLNSIEKFNDLFEPFELEGKAIFASYGNDKTLYLYESKKSMKNFIRKKFDNEKLKNFEIENCNEIECDSFVRRNCFSPDGKFLIQVGMKASKTFSNSKDNEKKIEFLAVIWNVENMEPIHVLKGFDEPVILCNFYPYKVKNGLDKRESWLGNEQYFFAIGTTRSVIIYDTTRNKPVFVSSNIHCTYLTDLAWRNDGLGICSSDGYVSFVKLGIDFFEKSIELNN